MFFDQVYPLLKNMRLGYNTNGFAHHRWSDALRIIADIGFQSVALTLDHTLLDPPDRTGVDRCLRSLTPVLEKTGLGVTIETGARFILDPYRKHQPTLISRNSEDRQRRVEYLWAAVEIAAAVNADSVSLWSGTPDDEANQESVWNRLTASLQEVLMRAADRKVRLAFEPEPGMFIDKMDRVARLVQRVNHPLLGLTLDVGHLHCSGDGEAKVPIRRWKDRLWNVHIEDMRRGMHEHLMFGEGDMDFSPIFDALRSIRYTGPVQVELSRHSHNAVETARRAFEFLKGFVEDR